MALLSPATPGAPPLDLPWTLTGGRGIFGLDPVQGALAVWAALIAFTLLFVIVAGLLSRWQWGRLNRADARAAAVGEEALLSPSARAGLRAEAGELIRQAAATAAAAKRAQSAVAQTRAGSLAAQQAREVAWKAFDAAQKAYERALREAQAHSDEAGGEPAANGNGQHGTGEDEKRDVARAALSAYRRGDITVEQLGTVFRKASGWSPLLELQAREVELRRSAESRARRLYQAAAGAERAAVKAADVAVVAAHALAEEAVEVAAEARAMRNALKSAGLISERAPSRTRAQPRKIPRQRSERRQFTRA